MPSTISHLPSPFGALGDLHGDFASTRRIMERHREVPFWLCVGDVADDEGRYEALPAPLYWIKGNNENFDTIEAATSSSATSSFPRNLHYVPNGVMVEIPGDDLRIAGLGGTFAPTMYDLAAPDLPHPSKGTTRATALADRRRHFVREEVESCKAMRGVDLFLSHEAPVPFRVGRIQAGKRPINDVLRATQPRLHLFGHHHRFVESISEGVASICLDAIGVSYLLIDRKTLEYQHLPS